MLASCDSFGDTNDAKFLDFSLTWHCRRETPYGEPRSTERRYSRTKGLWRHQQWQQWFRTTGERTVYLGGLEFRKFAIKPLYRNGDSHSIELQMRTIGKAFSLINASVTINNWRTTGRRSVHFRSLSVWRPRVPAWHDITDQSRAVCVIEFPPIQITTSHPNYHHDAST